MSNLKLLTQFATVRLEIQVSANALQAGTVAVAKMKCVKPGMNGRQFAGFLLNITCSNQREIVLQKLLYYWFRQSHLRIMLSDSENPIINAGFCVFTSCL